MMVNVYDGQTTELLGHDWYFGSARWLPNSRDVLVSAARQSTLTIPPLLLWVVVPDEKRIELRTPDLAGSIGFHIHHDMPSVELTRENSIVALDSETAFVSIQIGGRVEVWRVSLCGAIRFDPVLSGDRSCIVLDINQRSDQVLFARTDTFSPPELKIADLKTFNERRVTHLNDDVLIGWPRFDLQRLSFKSSDGLDIDAWFLARRSSEAGPLPTVLFIHGGPYTAAGYAFRYDLLLLAANGYGVVYANFRGSAGYGERFSRAIMGDWGDRAFPDHIGAVDAVVNRGLADPERLGVWGASHGGFATCWIVGHTGRFKAAIAEAAVTSFTTLYYLTDAPDVYRRELGGRPHEIPDVYRSRSPLTYAHRCSTPTLLVHGEDDLRCPIAEAEQFYRALQDVNCVTELIRIPNCSHLGTSVGPLAARQAQNQALIDWFGRYLRGDALTTETVE
jgi:dipeptidyl aminopeptidase/acylaminoacyl peptidase